LPWRTSRRRLPFSQCFENFYLMNAAIIFDVHFMHQHAIGMLLMPIVRIFM
jgi:hypothetical protein